MGRATVTDEVPRRSHAGDGLLARNGGGERDLFDYPFDHYQRFRPVATILEGLRSHLGGNSLLLLDVGGGSGHLTPFLDGVRTFVVDVRRYERPDVLASGAALPFAPASVDAVVCIDTLEHVPEEGRTRLLAEAARVARDLVVVAAPFDEPRVRAAERFVEHCHRSLFGRSDQWLEEHASCGLPSLQRTVEALARDRTVRVVPNGYLPFWRWTMALNYVLLALPESHELHRRVNGMVNRRYYPISHREPSYRKLVIAARGEVAWLERLLVDMTRDSLASLDGLDRLEAESLGTVGEGIARSIGDKVGLVRELEGHLAHLESELRDKSLALASTEAFAHHVESEHAQEVRRVGDLERYVRQIEDEFGAVDRLVNDWGVEKEQLKRRNDELEALVRQYEQELARRDRQVGGDGGGGGGSWWLRVARRLVRGQG